MSLLQITPFAPDPAGSDPQTAPAAPAAIPSESVPTDDVHEETPYKLHRRFDRLGRLYGDSAVKTLMDARVVVFGLGGVGSFAAEALARSAIGHLFLVDFDDVCVTNANRQLQALKGNIGKPKAEVLRDRLALVNPQAKIEAARAFYNAERAEALLTPPWPGRPRFDFVVDCIDNITAKTHLLATCHAQGIPVVSSTGAAGKLDPTRIKITDLADSQVCRMAKDVRQILRRKYDFPERGPMGIPSVWSDESRHWPKELSYDGGQGFKCVCPNRSNEHGCDSRQLIDGTAVFVTGAFGLACASVVVNTLTEMIRDQAAPAKALRGTKPQHLVTSAASTDDDRASP
jgi:tRNA A37 threonylcarbamoyladenosine dehydratase